MKLLGKPYTPYKGDLTAGFTGAQTQAQKVLQGMNPGSQGFQTPRLIDNIPGAEGTQGGSVQDYMDPYLQQVLEPILRNINSGVGKNLQQDDANATFAGGFRDTGHQLERSEDKRLGLQATGDATGRVMSDAFNSAMGNRNIDINRILANRDSTQNWASDLFDVGSAKQKTNQAGLTSKYAEFLRKIGYDEEKVQKIANVIASLQSGTPVTQPSTASSLIGGATSLVGAALPFF